MESPGTTKDLDAQAAMAALEGFLVNNADLDRQMATPGSHPTATDSVTLDGEPRRS